jgi:thiamine-phosphate pyrophosphorylase
VDLSLYVITANVPALGRTHADVARAAVEGGATVVQFRDKELERDAFLAQAGAVRDACRAAGVAFVVNDDPEAAMTLRADGLHLGQEDLEALDTWRPDRGALLGISVTEPTQVEDAIALGADYLGAGPVFATPSKYDAASPMGLAGLAEAVARSSVPVVAIGGITEESVRSIVEAGASGVCVISAIASAPDAAAAARGIRAAVDGALKDVART